MYSLRIPPIQAFLPLLPLVLLVSLAPLPGCPAVLGFGEMGDDCSTADDCTDGGTCLKGVCSGYACDDGCINDTVCGKVQGVSVCVLECASDADCLGDQSCTEVRTSVEDDAATSLVCM
jgi:hypothetical protein